MEEIEKLKKENFRLRSVIECFPGSVYWKDKNGYYLGRNTYSMDKMYNFNLESNLTQDFVVGKTDYDFFDQNIADRYRKHDLEVINFKKEIRFEEPLTLPNGEKIFQLSTKKPLYDENGEIQGIVGNTVDITHLKKMENELEEARKKAEESMLAKNEFMYNMQHDIRTPFCGLFSISEALHKKETDTTKKEYLGYVKEAAEELLDYCNKILEFTKVNNNLAPIISKKFNLKEIIDSVYKMELPAAKAKNLDLLIDWDDKIPSFIIGDAYRIKSILLNLIGNAIKFTNKGHITVKLIALIMSERQTIIQFIVEDTGIGMASDKLDYIFEKFTRLHPSYEGIYKGIGLGLRLVKQYVDELDGDIELDSYVDKGTKFSFSIPFKIPLTTYAIN